jgi:DNA polymerase III epsilon subunit-like protein
MNERKIAMTDVETSGDIFEIHEILEIGLVVFDPQTLEITDTLDLKTKPTHIENAVPIALQVNGYNEKDWENAVSLEEAMQLYSAKTEGCIMCAYNAAFDWGFLSMAFRKTKVGSKMDYHYLDLLSIAWAKGLAKKEKWSLKSACELFGVPPEPPVHRAINGAMTEYELFKKLAKI